MRVRPSRIILSIVTAGSVAVTAGPAAGAAAPAAGAAASQVQNQFNTLAVVRLNADGTAGQVVNRYTNSRFDTPTTVARYDGRLYLVNARFNTPVTPDTTYTAEAVPIAEVLGG